VRSCAAQLVCGLVLLAMLPRQARADEAPTNPYRHLARSEMAALQYHEAQSLLTKALEHGSSNPAQLADIYRMSAEVAAGLGQEVRARELFEKLLALRPDTALPLGTSPKIAAPFAAALESMSKRGPLRARYLVSGTSPPKIVLVVEADPFAMVAGARARFRTKGQRESRIEAKGKRRIELALPAGDRFDVIVSALDAFGNELVVHGSWEVPIRVPPPAAGGSVPIPPGPPPFYARWYLWGGVGAAFAATGIYFGLAMQDDQSDLDALHELSRDGGISYDDAKAIEKRGQRNALVANISFVAAGVAGAVSAFLLARALRRPSESAPRTAIVPYVADGPGVAVHVRF